MSTLFVLQERPITADDARQRFGRWLDDRLNERGITVSQLSAYLDVGQSTVSRWKTGFNVPDPANCRKIAEYFHRPVREALLMAGHLEESEIEPVRPPEIFASKVGKLTPEQWQELIDITDIIIERDERRRRDRGE